MYLGGYASETEAARAYDKAALKYWGLNANLNFDRGDYGEFFHEIDGADAETYGIFPLNARRLRDCPYPKPYSSLEGSATSARTVCSHGAIHATGTFARRTRPAKGALLPRPVPFVHAARYTRLTLSALIVPGTSRTCAARPRGSREALVNTEVRPGGGVSKIQQPR